MMGLMHCDLQTGKIVCTLYKFNYKLYTRISYVEKKTKEKGPIISYATLCYYLQATDSSSGWINSIRCITDLKIGLALWSPICASV